MLYPSYVIVIVVNFYKGLTFPVVCKVGAWKAWGECSATCDGGNKTRAREVVQNPMNGGAECPDLEETVMCNTDQCEGTLFSSYHLL